jgi:hypothetical protein
MWYNLSTVKERRISIMTTTIASILINYGFTTQRDGSLFWGQGSLVWGTTATIKNKGGNAYMVKYHKWAYDCDGEPIIETVETVSLYGAQALGYLFEKLPLF